MLCEAWNNTTTIAVGHPVPVSRIEHVTSPTYQGGRIAAQVFNHSADHPHATTVASPLRRNAAR